MDRHVLPKLDKIDVKEIGGGGYVYPKAPLKLLNILKHPHKD